MAEGVRVVISDPKWLMDESGARVSFSVQSAKEARAICDIIDSSMWVADIHKSRPKRSRNANDLLWEMCTRISEAASRDGLYISKEDVYRDHIKAVGVCDFVVVLDAGVDKFMAEWCAKGIGWFAEVVDFARGKDIDRCKKVCVYYGSSTYDVQEMSRLLGSVMQTAKDMGIDTMSEREKSLLLEEWGR